MRPSSCALAAFAVVVTSIAVAQDSVREGYVSTADGVRLYYRELGSGDPVLVVPFATWLAYHSPPTDSVLVRDIEKLLAGKRPY